MGTSVKEWGQFRPSTPRQVARGARSGRHNGAKPSCHNHSIQVGGRGQLRAEHPELEASIQRCGEETAQLVARKEEATP